MVFLFGPWEIDNSFQSYVKQFSITTCKYLADWIAINNTYVYCYIYNNS